MSSSYFLKKSFDERVAETQRMREKHPDRIFIYLEKQEGSRLPTIDKHKYLVPKDLTIGQMIHVIRKRIDLSPSQSIYLFTENNTLPSSSQTIESLFITNAKKDGFMDLTYNTEEVYG